MNQMNQMTETQRLSNDKFHQEITVVRQNIDEVKEMLQQFKVVSRSKRESRRGLFSRRRRSIPVEVVPETTVKSPLRLDELLPLLPQLGGMIPQLNNPKVAETLKILSNPAVAAMIQQFMANSGGKAKAMVPARRRA